MAVANVVVREIRQQEHAFSLDAKKQFMRSEVLYSVEVDGKTYEMRCIASQPKGTAYNSDEFEVGEYSGPYLGMRWNHAAFRDEIERIYRNRAVVGEVVGSKTMVLTMRNNTFIVNERFTLELPD